MARIAHFEIGVTDAEQARSFYESVFGWQFRRWEGPEEYWLIITGADDEPGINGGLMRHKDGQPRTVNTVAVASVDAVAEQVIALGGQVVVPKMTLPGVGYLAYCTDPDGILFGIMTSDPSAGA